MQPENQAKDSSFSLSAFSFSLFPETINETKVFESVYLAYALDEPIKDPDTYLIKLNENSIFGDKKAIKVYKSEYVAHRSLNKPTYSVVYEFACLSKITFDKNDISMDSISTNLLLLIKRTYCDESNKELAKSIGNIIVEPDKRLSTSQDSLGQSLSSYFSNPLPSVIPLPSFIALRTAFNSKERTKLKELADFFSDNKTLSLEDVEENLAETCISLLNKGLKPTNGLIQTILTAGVSLRSKEAMKATNDFISGNEDQSSNKSEPSMDKH